MRHVDAVVVGAGFGGLYSLYKLRGQGLSVQLFERGSDVGGTWFWNRYPGARCDVQSVYYSYSFDKELEQEWEWTEKYATQPEILKYLSHVADRFDLRPNIALNSSVVSAEYDAGTATWTVSTDTGDQIRSKYLVMATGALSAGRLPDIEGLDSFNGETHHTGSWPQGGVDFTGKRVGVLGTGSSGIQAIPLIAREAEQLTVFQRTPSFSLPAHNEPLDPGLVKQVKATYGELREQSRQSLGGQPLRMPTQSALEVPADERNRRYEEAWQEGGPTIQTSYVDLMISPEANETAAAFVRAKIDELVQDPATAELLKPKEFPLGAKRVCVDSDYYATFNRENVTLKDVKGDPIVRITPAGVRTQNEEIELDVLVFATGFDALTGSLDRIHITGRDGATLKDTWAAGPRTYLGISVTGFPNMFIVAGPGSPSVLTNMVMSIEQHVEWISDHVEHLEASGLVSEANPAAQDEWVEHVNQAAAPTLFMKGNSWYLGANVPGKPRVFMPYVGGHGNYRAKCDDVAAKDYEGFDFTPAPAVDANRVPA
ncbi:flavin-containing monooxygenase [bacterium RCC_150]